MNLFNDIKAIATLILLSVILSVGCGDAAQFEDATITAESAPLQAATSASADSTAATLELAEPVRCEAVQSTQTLSAARLGKLRRDAIDSALKQAEEACGGTPASVELDAVDELFGSRTVAKSCWDGTTTQQAQVEEETYELELEVRSLCDAETLDPMVEVTDFDNVEAPAALENILVEQARFDDAVDRCKSYDCCLESARGVERCSVDFPAGPGI